MAAATVSRKHTLKRQESVLPEKLHRDLTSSAAFLPDKKEWISEHSLLMLLLNGCVKIFTGFVFF